MEDYLEAIFRIVSEKQAARAKDIANVLNVNNASVTGALRVLSEKGYINYAPYDVITLTMKGNRLAKDIVRRHEALRDFFVKVLHIEQEEAEKNACGMEHSLSPPVLNRLIRFTEFIETCPRGGESWVAGFWNGCESGCDKNEPYEGCRLCIQKCLDTLDRRRSRAGGSSHILELTELVPGQRGKIVEIRGEGGIRNRLEDMGVNPGNIVEVEDLTPLGDSMDIKVKGYHLNLREDEAAKITVEIFE